MTDREQVPIPRTISTLTRHEWLALSRNEGMWIIN
jgi:hypothetical protein